MIRIVVSVFFILFSGSLLSQKFEWAKQVGSATGSDEVTALATTQKDTVVAAGFFGGTLPPSISASAGGGKDVFVRATKEDGTVAYNALHFNTTGANDAINGIAMSSNASFVTGKLQGTLAVTNGSTNLTGAYGAGSYFLAKVNAAGNADWVVPSTNNVLSEGKAIATDAAGNIYVAGVFKGTMMIVGQDTVTSQGINDDIFIYKYNSSGVAQWLKSITGSGNEEVVGLKFDNSRLLILGNFNQSIQLNTNATNSLSPNTAGAFDVFIAAFNTNGVLGIYSRPFHSAGNVKAEDLAVLSTGNIAIGGGFTTSITDGTNTSNSAGGEDIFIGTVSSTFGSPNLKTYGGVNSEKITNLEADNNLFAFGEFGSNLTFGAYSAPANSSNDIFLLSWSNTLTEYSAHGGVAGTGSNIVSANSMALGGSNLYFGGQFRRIADFKNAGTFVSNAVSFFDGYIARATTKEIYCPIDDSVSLATNLRVQGDSALLCFSDSGQLSSLASSVSYSYQWFSNINGSITGATTQSFQASVTDTFRVVITDNQKNCTDTSRSINVFVDPKLNVAIGDTVVCDSSGQFIMPMIPAYSLASGSLSGSSGINQSTGEFFPVFAGAGTDTIVYVYTDPINGCVERDSALYEVRANPSISFATRPIFCQGDNKDTLKFGTTTLPIKTGYYEIAGANSFGIEDSVVFRADTLPANQNPGHSVTFYAIDSIGCTSYRSSQVVINPKPNVVFNFSSPIPFCRNTLPFTLVGGNHTGGVYTGSSVNSTNAMYSPALAVNSSDTVYYSFTDNLGCADTTSTIINIDTVPSVNFLFTTKICSSDSLVTLSGGSPVLQGNGVYSSPWVSSGNFFPRLSGVGIHPVSYIFEDLNGCKDSIQKDIIVNSLPGVSMASISPICENEDSRLLVGGTPIGGSYSLRGTALVNDLLDPSKFPSLPGGVQDSIVYSYTDTNNCTSIAITSLLIRRLDGLVFNPALTLNRLCNNDSIDLFAMGDTLFSPPPATGGRFLDENGDVISIFNGKNYLTLDSDTSKLSKLQYIYDYSTTGCSDTSTKFIQISQSPVASINSTAFACAGIGFEIHAEGGLTYIWDNDSTSNPRLIVQDSATRYFVTTTNINGCEDSASVLVELSNGSIISGKGTTTTLKKGQNVTIDVLDLYPADTIDLIGEITMINTPANSVDFYQEQGKKQDILSSVYYEPDPEYRRQDTADYRICDIVCSNICDTARLIFNVLGDPYDFIPNGFSPNGDGLNDKWVIPGIESYPECELYIYNRWGDLIFEAAPYLNEWEGQANKGIGGSDKIGDGIFFYVLITNDGDPIKGSIEMKSN